MAGLVSTPQHLPFMTRFPWHTFHSTGEMSDSTYLPKCPFARSCLPRMTNDSHDKFVQMCLALPSKRRLPACVWCCFVPPSQVSFPKTQPRRGRRLPAHLSYAVCPSLPPSNFLVRRPAQSHHQENHRWEDQNIGSWRHIRSDMPATVVRTPPAPSLGNAAREPKENKRSNHPDTIQEIATSERACSSRALQHLKIRNNVTPGIHTRRHACESANTLKPSGFSRANFWFIAAPRASVVIRWLTSDLSCSANEFISACDHKMF